jgi:DNA-directed RNA polymerase subunit N (RpoN/RPB10)
MPLWLRWWAFKAWFHRCPECGHRLDKHYDSTGPRWEDDKTAHMLGIGKYGCRRCGHGAVEERDAEAALREKIELVLRGSGLSNEPWKYDSNIHGWRCEYPGRYGKCDCFDELLNDLVRAVQGKEPSNE